MTDLITMPENYDNIRTGIVELLKAARSAAARNVNSIMTATYWEIGRRIVQSEQRGERRAEYGEQLIEQLARDLTRQFGRGFGQSKSLANAGVLSRMARATRILQTLSGEFASPLISTIIRSAFFNHFDSRGPAFLCPGPPMSGCFPSRTRRREPSTKPKPFARAGPSGSLTARSAANSTNASRFRRTKPPCWRRRKPPNRAMLITPEEAIKDPFVLEFLDLKDEYSESDLEEALIQHLTDFLLELGDDFAFVGRQRRLRIDDNWFRIDLVFFHRRLRCLVIIGPQGWQVQLRGRRPDAPLPELRPRALDEARRKPACGTDPVRRKGRRRGPLCPRQSSQQGLAAEYQTVLPDEKLIADELDKSSRNTEERRKTPEIPATIKRKKT